MLPGQEPTYRPVEGVQDALSVYPVRRRVCERGSTIRKLNAGEGRPVAPMPPREGADGRRTGSALRTHSAMSWASSSHPMSDLPTYGLGLRDRPGVKVPVAPPPRTDQRQEVVLPKLSPARTCFMNTAPKPQFEEGGAEVCDALDRFERNLDNFAYVPVGNRAIEEDVDPVEAQKTYRKTFMSNGRQRLQQLPSLILSSLFQLQLLEDSAIVGEIRALGLHQLQNAWLRHAPQGSLTESAFCRMWEQILPVQPDIRETTLLFRAFDRNGNGSVSMPEFLGACEVLLTSGQKEDRAVLSYFFTLVDGDSLHVNTNYVSKFELEAIVGAYEHIGASYRSPAQRSQVAQLAANLRQIIPSLPWQSDMQLSATVFHQSVMGHPTLRVAFAGQTMKYTHSNFKMMLKSEPRSEVSEPRERGGDWLDGYR